MKDPKLVIRHELTRRYNEIEALRKDELRKIDAAREALMEAETWSRNYAYMAEDIARALNSLEEAHGSGE